MLLRLAVWGLEDFKPARPKFGSDDSVQDVMLSAYPFLKSDSDLSVFLGYCLKFLLYQPPGLVLRHRKVESDEVMAGFKVPCVLPCKCADCCAYRTLKSEGGEGSRSKFSSLS